MELFDLLLDVCFFHNFIFREFQNSFETKGSDKKVGFFKSGGLAIFYLFFFLNVAKTISQKVYEL